MIPPFCLGKLEEERCMPPSAATFLQLLFGESKQKSQAETIYLEEESESLENIGLSTFLNTRWLGLA
jgi:hypothetical protein